MHSGVNRIDPFCGVVVYSAKYWVTILIWTRGTPVTGIPGESVELKSGCILCGGQRLAKISDRMRYEPTHNPPMRPHRCEGCGLVFLHPAPTEDQLDQFYAGGFRELYHGKEYDISKFHESGMKEAERRRDQLKYESLLRGALLEVGSATGYFLECASSSLERYAGIEPDYAQREFSRERGLEVYRSIEEIASNPFDLVVMFHVLEHVLDPVGFLRRTSSLLKPGGSLVVEVPNVDDALLTLYKIQEYEEFYWHPAHLSYFSAQTLSLAARKAGLIPTVQPLQRYTLSNHLYWLKNRVPGGEGWASEEFSDVTRRAYAEDLCRSFRCDTLWMIASR